MNDKEKFIHSLQKMGINPTQGQLDACDTYVNNLTKWQKKINLVGTSTLEEPYTRHVLDAAQLVPRVPRGTLLDVGSGAGIPGLILSIFVDNPITLCERIAKKTSFLSDTIRKLKVDDRCRVLNQDVAYINHTYDIITGRAVTNISNFLSLTTDQRHSGTMYILQKGKFMQDELDMAFDKWHFDFTYYESLVSTDSKILVLRNVCER